MGLRTASVFAALLALAGCGEGGEKISEIPFGEVRKALDGGPAAFDPYFATIRGKTVRWSGKVVESQRVFGDDYAQEGKLTVDLDGAGQGTPVPDVYFEIPVSAIGTYKPGQGVTFEGIILNATREPDGIQLQMNVSKIE